MVSTEHTHERSHIGDSKFHGGGYATADSRRIFCDVCRLQRWLNIEAELAKAQADIGMIPREAAEGIRAAARIDLIDLDEVARGIAETGHSMVPLLRAMQKHCGGYAGQFLHFGATTQDIQDTSQALEMRDVLDLVDQHLLEVLRDLVPLASKHRDSLMVGRTHAQPALPTTFGLKVAGWIDELLRHYTRLEEIRGRVLVAQLFGGVGTMAAFRGQGPLLLERFADGLGLGVPLAAWHVSRDRVAEFVSTLAMLCASLARLADEIRILSRPEFQEVEERSNDKQIGSSTMPHKQNPEVCEQIVVLARLAKSQVMLAIEGMILEHERDYRGTRLEWPAVADVSHYTLSALEKTQQVVKGLGIHEEVMERTAIANADGACTEALMFELGRLVGKQRAFTIVRDLSNKARQDHTSIRDCALESPEIAAVMEEGLVRAVFDPRSHLGSSEAIIDRVLAEAHRTLAKVNGSAETPAAVRRLPKTGPAEGESTNSV